MIRYCTDRAVHPKRRNILNRPAVHLLSGAITGDSAMNTFRCSRCKRYLPYEDFPKDKSKPNGKACRCKRCDAEQARVYHVAHREAIKCSKQARYWRNRERYQQKERERRILNPQKKKCRNRTHTLIRNGTLVVGPCEDCSVKPTDIRIEAHHEDYSKPREVVWLCSFCHCKRHRKYSEALNPKEPKDGQ